MVSATAQGARTLGLPAASGRLERNTAVQYGRGASGQGLVEYGLIITIIAIALIGVILILGAPIGAVFSGITASI